MMAVSSSKYAENNRKSSYCRDSNQSVEKRMTPFSIDDILSKSEHGRVSPKEGDIAAKEMVFPPFPLDFSKAVASKLCSWNQDAYAKWLEGLHRLCAVTSLQPFWHSDFRAGPNIFDSRFHVKNPARSFCFNGHAQPKLNRTDDSDLRRNSLDRKSLPKKTHHLSPVISNCSRSESKLAARRSLERQFQNGVDRRISSTSSDSDDGIGARLIESKESDGTNSDSPLSALEKLTCVTFKGMEEKQHELHAVAAGREARAKRRKCRTAFTAFQLSVLEQRFNCHKYLTPADRDQIAHVLGLSAPQVITWFQNRRAKQKRDLEELRNDIKTVNKWTDPSEELSPTLKVATDGKMEVERCPA